MMKTKYALATAALLATFAASTPALAMTRAEIKAHSDKIAADYKAAKENCDSLSGNAKDICMAEAKGKEHVARVQFSVVNKKDTAKAQYDVKVAEADADYAVAKEKCDDLSGNPKDVCIKDAKAAYTKMKADAKAEMASAKAQSNANGKVAEARKDAAEDKRDANYDAAKERCDKFSGDAKDRCISDAKAKFGMK